jgi:SAM-dependent MidA family methyltransferase
MAADLEVRDPATDGIEALPSREIIADPNSTTMQEIQQAIAEHEGPIPFSQYMGICLYGRNGYYSKGKADIRSGTGGDFKTCPMESTDFCEAVAVAERKLWVAMGRPAVCTVIESGAGNGVMAKDALAWARQEAPDFYAALDYRIVEYGDMALKQRTTISGGNNPATTPRRGSRAEASSPEDHRNDLKKVRWHRGSAIETDLGVHENVIHVSNELPDAFPVEVVRMEHGEPQQKYIGLDNGKLVEMWGPLQPAVSDYMMEFAVAIEEGKEIAVNLNAVAWQQSLNRINRGGIITIDYGFDGVAGQSKAVRTYPKNEQYTPLTSPGELDITSDVDFSVLAHVAEQAGLDVAFSGTQEDFLISCGVPSQDTLSQIKGAEYLPDAEYIRVRAAKWLGMRAAFRALVLTKGIEVKFSTTEAEPMLSAYRRIFDSQS